MRAVDIIAKKRDGLALSSDEIQWFIDEYSAGNLPDYQAAALLMAIYWRGMTAEETIHLTTAIVESGETLSLADIIPYAVDKHSTGGVGDKTTLALAPTVASLGLPVAKMSGRGLGFSGGTLDKLESIPGFRAQLSPAEFREAVRKVGLAVAGQTADLAPADGKLYALRDVTATVGSLPLIASSVMSKKLASGADAILLDVKVGYGAFMKTLIEAQELARIMVEIGKSQGRRMTAVLSDMHQPLGHTVGNAIELREAIETLRGRGPSDFRLLVTTLAGHMLAMGDRAADPETGQHMAEAALDDGSAYALFRQFIVQQGGDVSYVDDTSRLPKAPVIEVVAAPRSGYVGEMNAMEVGLVSVELGAGRARKDDPIDHSVGVELHAKVGQRVSRGEPLFTVHASHADHIAPATQRLLDACRWSDAPVDALPLIYEVIR
jgi:pyrimidine-nucleoside phosphorylase